MFCGNTSREIDVYLPRANKESNKINSWESRGKGGGVHVFSLIRKGGFEKLLCDLMGGCEKKADLKKNHLPPPPPAVYIMNAALLRHFHTSSTNFGQTKGKGFYLTPKYRKTDLITVLEAILTGRVGKHVSLKYSVCMEIRCQIIFIKLPKASLLLASREKDPVAFCPYICLQLFFPRTTEP